MDEARRFVTELSGGVVTVTVCRGIRGATTVAENTREAILKATEELLRGMVEANGIDDCQVAAVFFTTTADLNARVSRGGCQAHGLERCRPYVWARDGSARCLV